MRDWQKFCTRNPAGLCLLLALLTVLAALAGICVGAVPLPPGEILAALRGGGGLARSIVLYNRLPRVAASLLAGSALAVSGTLIQTALANPLASPGVIGVNAGAGLLTALCCGLFPARAWLTPLAAFSGAALGTLLVLAISQRAGSSRISLVLTGVAVSNLFSAAIDAVLTFCPEALNSYTAFRTGGFSGVTAARLTPAACMILPGILAALALANPLEVLALGPETAQSLGLPVRRTRLVILLLASALAGAAVSFAGLLGFVGLIAPQIIRRLSPDGGAWGILAAALGGGLLLAVCDLIARTLFRPYELPVGIVTSFLGGPFFIWLLFRQRGGRTHD